VAQRLVTQRSQRKKGQRHYRGHAVGDLVWLEGTNLKLTHLKVKLDAKQYGPFSITKEISPVVFQLTLPPQWHIHNVFHTSLLTPYKETEEHEDNFAQPPPELINGQEEYEVEQIMNSRRIGHAQKLQYLLCWKGYSRTHDSWQDAMEVHAPELVKVYQARKRSAVHTARIKGAIGSPPMTSLSFNISCINMSNGLSLPASTFSFIYPTTDHEETPTARTTNDHQYDDQVVLFGASRQQSVRTDPTSTDFDPLNVNIAMCNVWFEPEAIYCNNTWWEAFQDDGSEMSESGSSNVPGRPCTPVNWAGPESPFFVPMCTTYLPDPQDAIEPTIPSTPPHMPPLIGLTTTTTTTIPTMGIVPTATTYTSATANDGGHVDHTLQARDKACHHNHAHDSYVRTATGSYRYGVSTTFINDAPIRRVTKKKRNKHVHNQGRGQGQWGFYCGKCQEDGTDHVYKECPKWHNCVLCRGKGHYTYMCPQLHYGYMMGFCYVDDRHRNLGHRCPKSGFLCYGQLAYAYDYDTVDHYEGVSQWAEHDAKNPHE
jgi:Chromo (CHRromatin Organisation MOdifier) domain